MTDYNALFDWLSDPAPAFAAQEAWDNGKYDQIETVHVMSPGDGPFSIACGIGLLGDHIRHFRFSPEVIQRLGRLTDARGRSVLHESFLNHLQRMKLTVQLNGAAEGTLLLPGQPLLVMTGPAMQLLLLESALRRLCVESTWYATQAALNRWNNGDLQEEDSPQLPAFPWSPEAWRARAFCIGGGALNAGLPQPATDFSTLAFCRITHESGESLAQIRRLFNGSRPAGDVWLTHTQEEAASISKSSIKLGGENPQTIRFSRFLNLYQPVLAKGHPVLPGAQPGYLRQRTLTGLKAFAEVNLENYWNNWAPA